jgi:hypothetical protein
MTFGPLPGHGIGGRADLPLPGEVVLQAGGFVVLVSFLAVGLLWRRPRYTGPVPSRPLPAPLARAVDSAALRTVLRAAAGLLLAYLVVIAFAGPADPNRNPAPRALYVLAWVGVVPASLLLGPVWRAANPLRLAHAGLARALRVPVDGVRRLPDRVGMWPAALGLAIFVWLELVPAERADPPVVGAFLLGYAIVVTAAAVVFGSGWFDRGDPFEVYSTLVATMAPVGRTADGHPSWRDPMRGLASAPGAPGMVAVLAVWWGSTVFDGLSGSTAWVNLTQSAPLPEPALATIALVALFGLVAGSYRLATGPMAGSLVITLVPIAVGYTLAHYASLLLTEAPRGLAQLVGAQGPTVQPHPLTVAVIQVTAILVGHVVGVVAAHDRSLAGGREGAGESIPEGEFSRGRRLADQVPLVLVMIVYTMVGLYLLVIA